MQQHASMHTAKRFMAVLMAAVLAMGALALAGCGASDEEVIRAGITAELDAFKNPTEDSLKPYVGELDSSQMEALESYGIDIYEFLGHAFRGFDYEIGDIVVDGDTATANLTVSNIDVAKATSGVMDQVQGSGEAAAKVQELAESGDQGAIMKYIFELMYDAMDAATDTVSTDTTLKLTKTNNQWAVDEDSIAEMIEGMYGGLAG